MCDNLDYLSYDVNVRYYGFLLSLDEGHIEFDSLMHVSDVPTQKDLPASSFGADYLPAGINGMLFLTEEQTWEMESQLLYL